MVAVPSVSLAMQVAQFPASQENGGLSPARRAICSNVSFERLGTETRFLPRTIVTAAPRASSAGCEGVGPEAGGGPPNLSEKVRPGPGSAAATRSMNGSGAHTQE